MKTLFLFFVLVLAFAKTSYCFENHMIESTSNLNSDVPKGDLLMDDVVSMISDVADSNTVWTSAEENPEFVNGGVDGLFMFITENMCYPIELPKDIKTKSFVRFIVGKDGSILNPCIVKSGGAFLDKEALRVVGLLPKFKPAMHKGKPVNCWYIVPIAIDLSE
jgi:periplasmic protein TonB